jgi:hypothetical protein
MSVFFFPFPHPPHYSLFTNLKSYFEFFFQISLQIQEFPFAFRQQGNETDAASLVSFLESLTAPSFAARSTTPDSPQPQMMNVDMCKKELARLQKYLPIERKR